MKRRCQVCHTEYEGPERFCSLDGGPIVVEESVDDPLIGRTIDGRYFVRKLLGRGGMGVVYRAEHVGLDRQVAIKFVSHAGADGEARARFRQEARAASKVVHPHVVQVMDVGVDADADYIVMELVEGRDLQVVLANGAMDPDRVVVITSQVLDGLQAIHDAGIVHRDIKPANVLLLHGEADFIKITDFGIAKSMRDGQRQLDTGTGRIIGTPQFMAPEHLTGRALDHRADLYSVGTMMFLMLTGSLPFDGTSVTKLASLVDVPPPDLAQSGRGLSPGLVAAVAKALQKDPRDRFADARAFRAALAELAPSRSTEVRLPGPAAIPPDQVALASTQRSAPPDDIATVVERRQSPAGVRGRRRAVWVSVVVVSLIAAVVVLGARLVGSAEIPAKPGAPDSTLATSAETSPDSGASDALAAASADAKVASLIAAAEAAVRTGQVAKAIATYEEAIAAGGDIELEATVGELYEGLGASRDALAHFQRYVALGPPGAVREQAAARVAVLSRSPVTSNHSSPRAAARTPTAPAVPGPNQRRCECLGTEGGYQAQICQARRTPPRCRCRVDRTSACSVPDEVQPDGSTTCKAEWSYPESPGAECKGFVRGEAVVGTIGCTYCAARDGGQYGFIFFGNNGDTCSGHSLETGKRLTGMMVRCETEEEWNRPSNIRTAFPR